MQGRYFVFGKDVGGNEFAQLYRYDVADGRITLLTDGGRSQNGGAAWSTKGDRLAYGSTRRNGADRDIYVMNPADPKTDKLRDAGHRRRLAGRSTGRRTTAGCWSIEFASIAKSTLWLVDVGDRAEDGADQSRGERVLRRRRCSPPTAAAST